MDNDNEIIKLCARGMEQEGLGEPLKAAELFEQAWKAASTDYEKAIAAHYLARHQPSISRKLEWDLQALEYAERCGAAVAGFFPSLYLNIAKCYEDLEQREDALKYYQLALTAVTQIPGDGYGKMIRAGIEAGIRRLDG